MINIL